MEEEHGVDDILDRLPAGSFDFPRPPASLREEVYRKTARAVRARVRHRRLRLALAFAAVFGAGLSIGRLPGGGTPAAPAVRPPADFDRSLTAPTPGEIQSRVPEAVPEDRPSLLRQAGDSYLLSQGNIEGALECYRQYLEIEAPDGRRPSPSRDTWLLEALKQGRTTHPRR
jgi:hypothetical protein